MTTTVAHNVPRTDATPDARARPLAPPWWRGAVIYHVYPRSFLDTNGDGVGDLAGVIEKLPYIASLGVDGVWLSPFFTSPMHDFGYDVADYCNVDPIFGTLADADRLIARAHELGLKVIIDQVYSHTSALHPWFARSRCDRTNPKAQWYVWADPKPDGSPPNNWQSVFGGPAWTWDPRRGQYYFHNFLTTQPDLNVHNPSVQDALLDVARFWLERGVDGFRLDAINFAMHDPQLRDNPPAPPTQAKRTRAFDFQRHLYNQSHPDIVDFLEKVRAVTDAYAHRFTVAEVGGPDPLGEMKAFTETDARLNSAYSFAFLYADHITAESVRTAAAAWPGGEGEGWPSWAFSNHDAPRAVSRWAVPEHRAAYAPLALLLLLALRGNAFVYQGEELGLPQAHVPFEALQDPEAITNWPETLGRDGARTPMPWRAEAAHGGFTRPAARAWLPFDSQHAPLAVDVQEADPGSMLHVARRLIGLRRRYPALRLGSVEWREAREPVLAFERVYGTQRLLCVFNLSAAAATWASPRDLVAWRVVDAVGGGGDGDAAPAALAAFQGFIAEYEGQSRPAGFPDNKLGRHTLGKD